MSIKKKKIILTSLIIIYCSVLALAYKVKNDSSNIIVKSEKISTEMAKPVSFSTVESSEQVIVNSIFEEEQVVSEDLYASKRPDGSDLYEEILPKGTVVSVKPTNNKDWVEIISNPPKGFIQKEYLENRKNYIESRNMKRTAKYGSDELKNNIDNSINQFINEHGGDISVYIESVDESFSYNYKGDEMRRTASTIKLPFIAYIMTLVQQNQLDLNTELTYEPQFKIDGTGIIQYESFGRTYTILELSELVIRYSDNVAYLMLLNYVGEPQFIEFLKTIDPGSPDNRVYSTPKILTQTMKYVIEQKSYNKNMELLYNWMQNSTFDDGVSVGIPGVNVVHKTGWMPMYTVSNDISLVEDEVFPYYLTIMTVGYDESYSEQAISDLAPIIDDWMLQLAH